MANTYSFYTIRVLKQAAMIIVVLAVLLNITSGTGFEKNFEIAMESKTSCGGYPNRIIKLSGCNNSCNVTADMTYPLEIQVFFTLPKNYTGLVYNVTAKRNQEVILVYRHVKPGLFVGNISETLDVNFSSGQFRNKSGPWTFQAIVASNSTPNEIILCESFPIQIKFSNKTYSDSCDKDANIDECSPLFCLPTSGSSVKYSCQCNDGSAIWETDKEGGACKKIPGTLCSPHVPYDECITNAGCQPNQPNVPDTYYSCQCKSGYNITANNRGCIGANGDGGGASTVVVSILALQIVIVMSIFSILS